MAVRSGPGPRWPGLVAAGLWGLGLLCVSVAIWLDRLLKAAGRPDLTLIAPDAVGLLAGSLSATTVGAVLAARRPRHPVGWLLMVLGLVMLLSAVSTGYASYGLLARPGSLPLADLPVAIFFDSGIYLIAGSLGFILLLTPTGSLPSPRWRWWARLMAGAVAVGVVTTAMLPLDPPFDATPNRLAVPALAVPLEIASFATLALTGLGILAGGWSLVVRFRRARGVERQQLRLVAFAAALTIVTVLILVALIPAADPVLLGWATGACIGLLPVATGAAILRYRLYDLDRIVSRTVAYGLLTVILGGCYAAVVLGLGQLTGGGSSLVVAAATLAVAAAFQPLRRRVQAAVDRRFNRRRYDASRTIAAFSTRLRDEIELDSLRAELLTAVEETMQPSVVALWLRPASR
jgi:hypothetical protein